MKLKLMMHTKISIIIRINLILVITMKTVNFITKKIRK